MQGRPGELLFDGAQPLSIGARKRLAQHPGAADRHAVGIEEHDAAQGRGQLLALFEVALEVLVDLPGPQLHDALVRLLEPEVAGDGQHAPAPDEVADRRDAVDGVGHRRGGQTGHQATSHPAVAAGIDERASKWAVAPDLDADPLVVLFGQGGQERGRGEQPAQDHGLGAEQLVALARLCDRPGGHGGDDADLLVLGDASQQPIHRPKLACRLDRRAHHLPGRFGRLRSYMSASPVSNREDRLAGHAYALGGHTMGCRTRSRSRTEASAGEWACVSSAIQTLVLRDTAAARVRQVHEVAVGAAAAPARPVLGAADPACHVLAVCQCAWCNLYRRRCGNGRALSHAAAP